MIAKLIAGGRSFEKSLKARFWAAIALLCAGVVGLVCYFLLVPQSGLPDFARGFYLGAASGITAGAVILLVRVLVLLRSPEARKRAKIEEGDERERLIRRTAFYWAGLVTFFAATAALFVVLPLSMSAFFALIGAMVLYAVTFAVAVPILKRRL